MNPRSFPKRLDSKTSCLRITVPENLDLALEGLIRKVLRDQPSTDGIYAFAAEYFETLLRIRDKAGAEYTTTQLCPFHNDDEARDMIVLAGTFPKRVPGRIQGKGPAPIKAETKKESEKKVEAEKGVKRPKESLKESKAETEKKQETPDLIKKLPVLGLDQGLNGEKATDAGSDDKRAETVKEGGDEEEYLTSDPIKEFVERELTGGNSKEKDGEPSEGGSTGPTAREGQNEEAEGGGPPASNAEEKKGADGGIDPGAVNVVNGVAHAKEDGGGEKIEPEPRETDGKGVEERHVAKDEEDKIGEAEKPEVEEETQEKKEKENEDENSKLQEEEESRNKNSESVEPPSQGAAEKPAQELVPEVSASYIAETEVSPEPEGGEGTQSAGSSEGASPQEKGIAEGEVAEQPAEDKHETDAQPSTALPMKTDEESPETVSPLTNHEAKPVENDDASAAETEKSEKLDSKEARKSEGECISQIEGGEGEEPRTEAVSEPGSSPERGKGVQEVKEDGASFEEEGLQQTKGVESNKRRDSRDTEAEELGNPDIKSTEEEGKLTSGSAVEAEHVAEQPRTGADDSSGEAGEEKRKESGKLDPDEKVDGSEILNEEQLSHSHLTDSKKEAESKRGDEAGKDVGDKQLSEEEEMKGKDRSLMEQESQGNQTSREELPLQMVQNVECSAGTPMESTDTHGHHTPPTGISTTEEPKEEQADAKREATRDGSSPTEPGGTPEIGVRDTESAEPPEFKTEEAPTGENDEEAPTGENETASLASEELCSVVDIDHLKRGEGYQEEPNLPKSPPENAPEEKSAPEASTSEDLPQATAIQESEKPETDKEKDSAEKTSREDFEPSTEGKQVIIVEEPEPTNENPEKSSPPEIQIKTIQTHYYDTLRVPETVTREYRVHEMVVPAIDALLGAPSPPPSAHDDAQESPADEEGSGRLTDSTAFPPTPKTSPTSDGGVPTFDEAAEAQSQPPCHPADALLAIDGLRRDVRPSDSDDFPHPTTPASDVASNLFELSLREGNETFLANEKRFSSLEKEGIRFVTSPTTEETGKDELEGQLVDETTLNSAARSRPQTPANTEAGGPSENGEEGDKDDGRPVGSSGGSPPLSDAGATIGDSPPDSAEPFPRGEHENVPDAPTTPSDITPAAAGNAEEPLHLLQESNVLECSPEQEQDQAGSRADGLSPSRTPTGEASSAETDSATSSATKRADSVRREFASGRGLSSARSLDLGKRNPLLRTRSLSTHRHGVADFEVWSTIEKELEEAATKIQSKFRGYNTRKKLRREVAVQISTEESSKRSTPEEPDRPEDSSRATGEFHDGIVLPDHPR